MGASAVGLGIDCFTRLNLKERYVWDLGYAPLFPQLDHFPLTQGIGIECGLIAALFLCGLASQIRVLAAVQKKLGIVSVEDREKLDEEAAKRTAERLQEKQAVRSFLALLPPVLLSH